MEGVVFLLVNEAMPGFVKIGATQKDVLQRIRALSGTSVPFAFECVYGGERAHGAFEGCLPRIVETDHLRE